MNRIVTINVKRIKPNKNIILLSVFCVAGFAVRMYFFPFNLPIRLDGLGYFLFAHALSQDGIFPKGILGKIGRAHV